MVFFKFQNFRFLNPSKNVFVGHEHEDMETLIHESQYAEENSERHEVEMHIPLLDKDKIHVTTFQSMNAFIITYLIYY